MIGELEMFCDLEDTLTVSISMLSEGISYECVEFVAEPDAISENWILLVNLLPKLKKIKDLQSKVDILLTTSWPQELKKL